MTPREYREGLIFRLQELMRDAGLKPRHVAAAAGLPAQHVYNWLKGVSAPAPWHLPPIARLLGCSTGFLQFGEPE
jgi:predicted transcriptional regulator